MIREKRDELITVKKEITEAIYAVDDGRVRTVLVDYYINRFSLEQIAAKEYYSYRHVKRLRRFGEDAISKEGKYDG